MPYSKTTWVDDSTPAINAANLNNMEDGIEVGYNHSEETSNFHGITGTAAEVTDAINKKHSHSAGEGIDVSGTDDITIALDINGLTADSSPDGSSDYVATYDADAGVHKKVLLDNLPGGSGDSGQGPVVIWPWAYKTVVQGTWELVSNSDYFSAKGWYNSSLNNGDEIHYNVYLAAGTYRIWLVYVRYTDRGILDIYVDDTEVASFDMYGSSSQCEITSDSGNTISTSGLKTIKLKVDGQNASSSGYHARINALIFERTA